MNTSFRKSFLKDVKKLKQESLRQRIADAIVVVENAEKLSEISALQKLSGTDDCYRLRVGEYRLGLIIQGDDVTFVRCLH